MLRLNKIYNIDCLDGLKEIDDRSIDLIFTDPPYNIKYKNEGWDFRDDYLGFMEKVFVECDRVLKDTGSFYFFIINIIQFMYYRILLIIIQVFIAKIL